MIFKPPYFKEYIMARLVTLVVVIFIFFSIFLFSLLEDMDTILVVMLLLLLAFSVFVFEIYRGADYIEKELNFINDYLQNLNKMNEIEYQAHFSTQEFQDIYENLGTVLKAVKKREKIKRRYTAKLKLKNRQRTDMISAIAHEFRNPIASIMGYSQTLQDDPDIPQGLRKKFLGKIHSNGNKIEALLSRLILWNKFESGEAELHKSSFDLYILVQEIKSCLEDKYHQRKIIIKGGTSIVVADRTLIDIVLKNLIENALKYSKESIVVEIDNKKISVIDKGTGIASKDISKVTKKFYRSRIHSWDNSMGLGLSIVKNILSLHSTQLEIESKKERGSTFSFNL